MKTNNKKNKSLFKAGDWISTLQIPPKPGQKYTVAHVCKVLTKGKLLVEYGDYFDETIVEAKLCHLIKR